MSAAAAAPVEAVQPDPNRAVPNHAVSGSTSQVLGLVRTLITYGQTLADTLRQHTADPHLLSCFAFVVGIFGTTDLTLILARIARGLLRAAALEALLSRRDARGRDLRPTPIRQPAEREKRDAKPALIPLRRLIEDPYFNLLPTPEEIVAEDRRRPIGAILVDICLDLGIVPAQMDHATQAELRLALVLYGYSDTLNNFLFKRGRKQPSIDPFVLPPDASDPHPVGRKSEAHSATASPSDGPGDSPLPFPGWPIITYPEWPARSPQSPAPACTGPP